MSAEFGVSGCIVFASYLVFLGCCRRGGWGCLRGRERRWVREVARDGQGDAACISLSATVGCGVYVCMREREVLRSV